MKPVLLAACLLLVCSWMFPYYAYSNRSFAELDGYRWIGTHISLPRHIVADRLVLTDLCIIGLMGSILVLRWKEK